VSLLPAMEMHIIKAMGKMGVTDAIQGDRT